MRLFDYQVITLFQKVFKPRHALSIKEILWHYLVGDFR
jgi:hypothetical protein